MLMPATTAYPSQLTLLNPPPFYSQGILITYKLILLLKYGLEINNYSFWFQRNFRVLKNKF